MVLSIKNRALEEGDFLQKNCSGELLYTDRRFLLGKSLSAGDVFKSFNAEQLGLAGDVMAVIQGHTAPAFEWLREPPLAEVSN